MQIEFKCKCGHDKHAHRINPNTESGFGACFYGFQTPRQCDCMEYIEVKQNIKVKHD